MNIMFLDSDSDMRYLEAHDVLNKILILQIQQMGKIKINRNTTILRIYAEKIW